jgi:hypothetical protein
MLTPDQLTGQQKQAYEAQCRLAKKIFPVGEYDICNEDYHRSMGISKSGIALLKKAPLKYWHRYLNPNFTNEIKASFNLGSAVHKYLLERPDFDNEFAVLPDMKFTTKEGKAVKKDYSQKHHNKILLQHGVFEQVKAVTSAIIAHAKANTILKRGVFERSCFWIDEDTGLMVKSRPDILFDDWVIELKTTNDATEESFSRDIYRYGYHIQAAMAIDSQKYLYNKQINKFLFIACEVEEPYLTNLYALDNGAIDKGQDVYKQQLMKAQSCFINDDWQGESKNLQWISIPGYAF